MTFEMTVNEKIKARFNDRESAQAEMAKEKKKWQKNDFQFFMKLRRS
jgi:hypothetical protein